MKFNPSLKQQFNAISGSRTGEGPGRVQRRLGHWLAPVRPSRRRGRTAAQMRILRTSGVDLYSYFAQQVLDKQSPDVRGFLLRTSLMEDLDAELCAQRVSVERSHSAGLNWSDLLHRVRRNNLFVSEFDVQHRRLRYHSLFQEFLQNRFFQEQPGGGKRTSTHDWRYLCRTTTNGSRPIRTSGS